MPLTVSVSYCNENESPVKEKGILCANRGKGVLTTTPVRGSWAWILEKSSSQEMYLKHEMYKVTTMITLSLSFLKQIEVKTILSMENIILPW